MDKEAFKTAVIGEIRALVEPGSSAQGATSLWRTEDLADLKLIASDLADLAMASMATQDVAERAAIDARIKRLTGHAALLAFSRLNTSQQNAQAGLERLIKKVVELIIGGALMAL